MEGLMEEAETGTTEVMGAGGEETEMTTEAVDVATGTVAEAVIETMAGGMVGVEINRQ